MDAKEEAAPLDSSIAQAPPRSSSSDGKKTESVSAQSEILGPAGLKELQPVMLAAPCTRADAEQTSKVAAGIPASGTQEVGERTLKLSYDDKVKVMAFGCWVTTAVRVAPSMLPRSLQANTPQHRTAFIRVFKILFVTDIFAGRCE